MIAFDSSITIRVPASMASIASAIGRAMDPDVGGDRSFIADPSDESMIVCSTPCRAEFRVQALAMLTEPAILYYAVAADYARRWPGLDVPSLQECEQFVSVATVDQGEVTL